jgi:methyl-accepting chemotaxis protein
MFAVLDRLSLRTKFTLVALVAAASMLTALGVLLSTMNESIAFSAKERLGVAYHKPLRDLLQSVIAAQADVGARRNVEKAIAAVDAVHAELGAELAIGDKWDKIKGAWKSLPETGADTTPITDEIGALMDHVGNTSNLILDPDLDSYYLMDIIITRVPHVGRKMTLLRDLGASVLTRKTMTGEQRTLLSTTAGVSYGFREAIKASVETAVSTNGSLDATLNAPHAKFSNAAEAFLKIVENDVLSADRLTFDPSAFRANAETALAANFAFYDVTSPALDGLLEARIAKMTWKRNWLATVVLGLMALAGVLGVVVMRTIIRSASDAAAIAGRLARGDLAFDVPKASGDELGAVLRAMAEMKRTLDAFVEGQGEMSRQHTAGAVSYRMDADALPGTYGEMATSVNELVAQQAAITFRLVGVVEAYARGDFSVEVAPLPGELARVSDACNDARSKLLAVADEIKGLSAAAAAGEFDARGEESRFEFEYREMVANLNRLMTEAARGVDAVGDVLAKLAEGDLSRRVDGEFQGRFAALQSNTNVSVERLSQLIAQIRDSVESISTGAKEIAAGNQDLSNRTEQQASSLEETASSMEELTSTVRQNAENARQANQLVVGASDVAVRGGEVVRQVVTTMGEISASSKKIADIISVIDGIAFQTNILALNAAVEAARAGEQGRGFAVVATEVRNLAQRSANAAKEIKALISDSVGKVESGSRLVDEAGKTMDEIVLSVKRVTDIMSEIAAASVEQSSGIEQVNHAVTSMDEVTQQNAALVEEAAAAAESLEEQAQLLSQAVAVFKVGEVRPAVSAMTVWDEPDDTSSSVAA